MAKTRPDLLREAPVARGKVESRRLHLSYDHVVALTTEQVRRLRQAGLWPMPRKLDLGYLAKMAAVRDGD